MKLLALLGCLQLSKANGNYVSFELDNDGEAGEKYDQQLIAYLSRFDMDDDDRALTLLAKDRLGPRNKVPPNEINGIRKIRQLKAFIISQMDPKISASEEGTGFGRYCYYGCHCLPDKHHNEYQTFGKPVDKIDLQCKIMGTCYKCLNAKYGQGSCAPELTNYAFSINEKTKAIDCSMNRDPCRRDVCECDRQFAVNVAIHQHAWNVEYHIKRSGFDRYANCRPQKEGAPGLAGADSALHNNGMSFLIPEITDFTQSSDKVGGGGGGGGGGFGGPRPVDMNPSFSNTMEWSLYDASPFGRDPDSGSFGPEFGPEQCCNLRHFPDVFVPSRHHSCCGTDVQVSYNTLTHQCCDGQVKFIKEVCI